MKEIVNLCQSLWTTFCLVTKYILSINFIFKHVVETFKTVILYLLQIYSRYCCDIPLLVFLLILYHFPRRQLTKITVRQLDMYKWETIRNIGKYYIGEDRRIKFQIDSSNWLVLFQRIKITQCFFFNSHDSLLFIRYRKKIVWKRKWFSQPEIYCTRLRLSVINITIYLKHKSNAFRYFYYLDILLINKSIILFFFFRVARGHACLFVSDEVIPLRPKLNFMNLNTINNASTFYSIEH